ncbi:uncharacterized protein K460DRAFT_399593 [Cucurbitaria berberidis CBS 394.84]|uniref:Uncharacterized protein n=1 Tax=Cucurbitaria berberidis CBS 394.84 TaxID=1168544 RepID=A0A9P4G762_9PLEO|nr:uncharacterized protein K460DRAFT_399593 [Cucurbitaria berberidis CBS 394.84]KAF1839965.1 hypothetical protein K460DRAFT_399593 [Cucurbitaria berberidis CBS 394.84]
MQIPSGRLNIDTRTAHTGYFGRTTTHGMFVDQPSAIASGLTTVSSDAQPSTIAIRVLDITSSIGIDAPASSQTPSTIMVHTNPNPSTSRPPSAAEDTLSAGAIFAIIVGSIVGIIFPVVLLTQYIKRGNRMKEDNIVLEEILVTEIANEKAQDVGSQQLQETSARKGAADHFMVHFEQRDLEAKAARESAK